MIYTAVGKYLDYVESTANVKNIFYVKIIFGNLFILVLFYIIDRVQRSAVGVARTRFYLDKNVTIVLPGNYISLAVSTFKVAFDYFISLLF